MSNRLNSNERYARIGELLRGNPRTACAHVVSLSFLGGSSLPRRSSGRLQHAPQRPRTVDNSALRLCPTHVSFPAASDLFPASARNDSLAAHPPAKPCARTQLLSAIEGVGPFFTQYGKCTGLCTPIPGVKRKLHRARFEPFFEENMPVAVAKFWYARWRASRGGLALFAVKNLLPNVWVKLLCHVVPAVKEQTQPPALKHLSRIAIPLRVVRRRNSRLK